jgi:hypothetical protein
MRSPRDVLPVRLRTHSAALALLVAAMSVASCTSVAQITNLPDATCQATFEGELEGVLLKQGETPENAAALVRRTITILTLGHIGPRPFVVASPSGTDYSFFVDKTKSGCILRLYGRQKGFVRYTNNLTWIDSRPLSGCTCAD